jgi:DNA-binding transcriptional LysR family regulator
VQLTKQGHTLYSQTAVFLDNWKRIKSKVLEQEQSLSGKYTLGCHPSVAAYSLPLFLPQMLQENPTLEIKLEHDLSRKITERVISFEIDYGIVINPIQHPDLVIKKITQDQVCFFTKSKPTELQLADSEQCTIICDPDLLQTKSLLKQMSGAKRTQSRRFIESSSLEAIAELVAAGAGIGILPERVAQRYSLLRSKAFEFEFIDELSLVFRSDLPRTEAHKKFVNYVIQSFESSAKEKKK